jgi:glycosyltransferase involved in cell wall biosynthesis
MGTDLPKIAVIVAVFNGVETLQQSIDSIANQNYSNKELIIIDGGSTDGTIEMLKRNNKDISYWVSEPDGGIYDAWNKGLKHVSGSWVAFLGADDVYLPGALQAYASYLLERQTEKLDYISSRVNLVDKGQLIRTIGQPWHWRVFRRYMNVAHVGSLHNIALYEKYGVYDISYKICADYEFLLRPRDKIKTGYLSVPTVNMSIGGVSDGADALEEAMRAKVSSGGRSIVMCYLESQLGWLKLYLRKCLWY